MTLTFEYDCGYRGDSLEWSSLRGISVDPTKITLGEVGKPIKLIPVLYDGVKTPYEINSQGYLFLTLPFYTKKATIEPDHYLCTFLGEISFDTLGEDIAKYLGCDVDLREEETSVGPRLYVHYPTMWEELEFTLPTWALCTIVNGDSSGISEYDEKLITEFERVLIEKYGEGHWGLPDDIDEATHFLPSNDLTDLGDACVTVTFSYEVKTR